MPFIFIAALVSAVALDSAAGAAAGAGNTTLMLALAAVSGVQWALVWFLGARSAQVGVLCAAAAINAYLAGRGVTIGADAPLIAVSAALALVAVVGLGATEIAYARKCDAEAQA